MSNENRTKGNQPGARGKGGGGFGPGPGMRPPGEKAKDFKGTF